MKDSGGVVVGATSEGVYTLEAGNYTYIVTKDGYQDYEGSFTVTNKDEIIEVELTI